MKLYKGPQKLSSHQLALLLKPSLSGTEDFKQRQFSVIKALFEALSSKNIIMTTILAEQIFTNLQTNFKASDIMDEYGKFSAVQTWAFKQYALPVKQNVRGGKTVLDPVLEDCRKLIQQ
jgi:anionic cell wall polymer biosynthesis LytR-Cps2A-Psr (LCP) family protein